MSTFELPELQAQHIKGHGPCGCADPARCVSARYLAIIERQQFALVTLERRRARLYKRLREMGELDHRLHPTTHTSPFEKCRFVGCAEVTWSLRMGGPLAADARVWEGRR
jgi:hypothetical protein